MDAVASPRATCRLPDEACRLLAAHFPDLDLAAVRIRLGLPVLVRRFAAIDPAAVVLGRTVYFAEGWYDPSTPRGLAAIAHELVHLRQAAACGFARFLWRYTWAFVRGRLRGLGPEAAYDAIPFEVEACAVERELRAALESAASAR